MSAKRKQGRGRRAWGGRLVLWGGRALYVGPTFDTTLHAHHAVQVCVALDGAFRLRSRLHESWQCYRGAVIPSDRPHQLDGGGSVLALLYVDPESAAARRLVLLQSRTHIARISDATVEQAVRLLRTCWLDAQRNMPPERLAGELIDALAPARRFIVPLDDRVERVLALQQAPERRMGIAQIAVAVGLSPSRLAHVFRAQTGLAIRRYLLWLRLGDALQEITRGASLTAAAHAAGFADSAHLTRTFRRMLGLAPSALVPAARAPAA
jgi:AraC family transcriptional regulator